MADKDPFAAPPDADLSYNPQAWRPFAVRADSLVIDVEENVKLHTDKDLQVQQASLKDWQFTRMIIVRSENRQVIIGNGSVLAAMRNGWEYVPVDFRDLTAEQARLLGAADNMTGTVADWNDQAVTRLLADMPTLGDALSGLSLDLGDLCSNVLDRLIVQEETEATPAEPIEEPVSVSTEPKPPISVKLSHRVLVICPDEATQIAFMSKTMNEGLECRVSTVRAN